MKINSDSSVKITKLKNKYQWSDIVSVLHEAIASTLSGGTPSASFRKIFLRNYRRGGPTYVLPPRFSTSYNSLPGAPKCVICLASTVLLSLNSALSLQICVFSCSHRVKFGFHLWPASTMKISEPGTPQAVATSPAKDIRPLIPYLVLEV